MRASKSRSKGRRKTKIAARRTRARRFTESIIEEEPSPYEYSPLQHQDSIRLLTLPPGEFASPIIIHLAEARFSDHPPYEALSYTWATEDGDCALSSQIECDEGNILHVTKNCELALRYLRDKTSTMTLWIDAICINQQDDNERGHQVGIMRDVYSNADKVLVWLGEESTHRCVKVEQIDLDADIDSTSTPPKPQLTRYHQAIDPWSVAGTDSFASVSVTQIFMAALAEIMTEVRQLQAAGQDPKSSLLYQELVSQIQEGYVTHQLNPYNRGFRDILRRRWWSRVWVVQEVFVSKSATLICSHSRINYRDIYDWQELLHYDANHKSLLVINNFGHAYKHLGTQSWASTINSRYSQGIQCLEILCRARYLEASNPLDKIFGILGLSHQLPAILPAPDYQASMVTLYTQVAANLLSTMESLDTLYEASAMDLTFELPSWVPDWSQLPGMRYWGYSMFSATRRSKAKISFCADGQELQIAGRIFDVVEQADFADADLYVWRLFGGVITRFLKACATGFALKSYPTGNSVEDAVWRTLCWDVATDRRSRADPDRKKAFREWYELLTSDMSPYTMFGSMLNLEHSFLLDINTTSPFCTTARGYLTAVSRMTKVGDCIALLSGGEFPFVLRPTGDNRYRLIGLCYVHGIMDGEAWVEDDEGLETFTLH